MCPKAARGTTAHMQSPSTGHGDGTGMPCCVAWAHLPPKRPMLSALPADKVREGRMQRDFENCGVEVAHSGTEDERGSCSNGTLGRPFHAKPDPLSRVYQDISTICTCSVRALPCNR